MERLLDLVLVRREQGRAAVRAERVARVHHDRDLGPARGAKRLIAGRRAKNTVAVVGEERGARAPDRPRRRARERALPGLGERVAVPAVEAHDLLPRGVARAGEHPGLHDRAGATVPEQPAAIEPPRPKGARQRDAGRVPPHASHQPRAAAQRSHVHGGVRRAARHRALLLEF